MTRTAQVVTRMLLVSLVLFGVVVTAQASTRVFVQIGAPVPVAPVLVAPAVIPPPPAYGIIWRPGYYSWSGYGYGWVPGAWVQPPRVGVLWTPGYWGFVGAFYVFHRGYWGTHVGYYGGINYGFGYFGVGFAGGRWVGNSFAYNRTVNNVNLNIVHNTYSETVINNASVNKVSYNGGPGGTSAVPTAQERAASNAPRVVGAHGGTAPAKTPHHPKK